MKLAFEVWLLMETAKNRKTERKMMTIQLWRYVH